MIQSRSSKTLEKRMPDKVARVDLAVEWAVLG
jgi:hypothetical protein